MKFTKISNRLYIAEFSKRIGLRLRGIHLRIDGRAGDYRVDRLGTLGFIWESVDHGEGFSSVKEATAFARMWLREAVAQETLTPRTTR
jgi:hypothetical protein